MGTRCHPGCKAATWPSAAILVLPKTDRESVAGLTLTSANYEEAVAALKRRFGNTQDQLIVDKHMDALLNLPAVSSHHDLRGLRHLYDDSLCGNTQGVCELLGWFKNLTKVC